MAVVIHDSCDQLANRLAVELFAVRPGPEKSLADLNELLDVQLERQLRPRAELAQCFDRLPDAFKAAKVGLECGVDQIKVQLCHGFLPFMLTGPEDSEPFVKSAILLTSFESPAASPVSSSPDARIDATSGENCKGKLCNSRLHDCYECPLQFLTLRLSCIEQGDELTGLVVLATRGSANRLYVALQRLASLFLIVELAEFAVLGGDDGEPCERRRREAPLNLYKGHLTETD